MIAYMSSARGHPSFGSMNWKIVRLELASSCETSRGSASRAYLLRVPLDPDGCIDADAIASNPARATVARYWASEPDMYGRLECVDGDWVINWPSRKGDSARIAAVPLRVNDTISVDGPDGCRAFSVASITDTRTSSKERA